MDYKFENGRRYHAYKEGIYLLPNDEKELDRLDLQHHLWRMTFDGKLYVAPITPPIANVLDNGTGTGIWAIEFADEHPNASVLGTDLSPVQPSYVPANCSFMVDDVESDWTFGNKQYDFIHSRFLVVAMRDWPKYFRQSFEHLRPGGWIEVQEANVITDCDDESWGENRYLRTLFDDITAITAKQGIHTRKIAELGPDLEKAGFRDIELVRHRWPLGPWSDDKKEKTLGVWARKDILEAVHGAAMGYLVKGAGQSVEEVELRLVDIRKELNDPNVHQYINLYVWYAQKPESNEGS